MGKYPTVPTFPSEDARRPDARNGTLQVDPFHAVTSHESRNGNPARSWKKAPTPTKGVAHSVSQKSIHCEYRSIEGPLKG